MVPKNFGKFILNLEIWSKEYLLLVKGLPFEMYLAFDDMRLVPGLKGDAARFVKIFFGAPMIL